MATIRKSGFQIDRSNLGKAAQDAFSEHTAKRMSYAEWKSIANEIANLQKAENHYKAHGAALFDKNHPDHAVRAAELQAIHETAYPDEGAGPS